MHRSIKILLIILGILATLICGFYIFLQIALGAVFGGPTYNKQDLINNYEQKKAEITEVKAFIDSKIDTNTYIHIEFDNGQLGIFHLKQNGIYDSNWNLDIDSSKADSLLTLIGWTIDDLEILKNKLEKANCISVASGEPTSIGWQRSGMGMFFYDIFDQNLSDSLISEYNGGCTHIFYKDNVVLKYGGGAIGPQCFPGYERKK
jgi:hypothetical protein